MDEATLTIDRHTPIIPEGLWDGLTPTEERLQTKVKNSFIISKFRTPTRAKAWPDAPQKVITQTMLDEAERAVHACGPLTTELREYARSRGLTDAEIDSFKIRSVSELAVMLPDDYVDNLSLKVSSRFDSVLESGPIEGLAFPCWQGGRFFGFCVRVINKKFCKYLVSIPHRFCFGIMPGQEVWVVEGVIDAVLMRRLGFNAMGMADSQPNYYKMLVANRFETVNLLFDGDRAGLLGMAKAHTILTDMFDRDRMTINAHRIDKYEDPAEAINLTGSLPLRKLTIDETMAIMKQVHHEA